MVLSQFGCVVEKGVTIRVHDSTADTRYMVLPQRPGGTEGWDEQKLRAIVTRDALVGVQRILSLSVN